jgi:hypothetical protein
MSENIMVSYLYTGESFYQVKFVSTEFVILSSANVDRLE